MKVERDFKGIWIPKEIWLLKDLTLLEKAILVEIDSLDRGVRGCFASNEYFAEFFNSSAKSISNRISKLVSKGYITTEIIKHGLKSTERKIKVDKKKIYLSSPLIESSSPQKVEEESTKSGVKSPQKVEYNNTSLNNTINNTYKESYYHATEIFDYWNSKKIIKHQQLTKQRLTQIEKALKEFSKDEIITYIDRYDQVIKDDNYFFDTEWSLEKFLKQPNAIYDFTDEGSKWNDYQKKTKKHRKEDKRAWKDENRKHWEAIDKGEQPYKIIHEDVESAFKK